MATYSQQPLSTFVLSPEALGRLANLFVERVGKTSLRVECVDGLSYEFGAVSELSDLENSVHSRINTLILTAQSEDRSRRASVSFLSSRWSSVSLELTGPNESVVMLREAALDLIAGLRPWYEPARRIDFVVLFFVLYVTLWIVGLCALAFKWLPASGPTATDSSQTAFAQLVVFGLFAGAFFGGSALNRIRDAVCPAATFLIGQGKSRYDFLEKVRWGIVIAFLVSLGGSVMAGSLLPPR